MPQMPEAAGSTLPNGRGRHATATVPGNSAAHRGTAAAAATSASMRRSIAHALKCNRREECVRMSGKIAKSDPRSPRGGMKWWQPSAPRPGIAERTEMPEHPRQFRDSSGECRLMHPTSWPGALWRCGHVIWVCRVAVASAAAGGFLLAYTVQARDLFADLGVKPLQWVLFFALLFSGQ
jgi:hypothetical protein